MPEPSAGRYFACSICSQLRDHESAVTHVMSSEGDTAFPEAVGRLRLARDIRPGHPGLSLLQCPECGTYYLYRTVYEYLIGYGGSYDEAILWRMADAVGVDYLEGRRNEPLSGMW